MSKVLYEMRKDTHVQWSLARYDLEKMSYENKMIPPNLKNYHISKIVDDFIKLYREINTNALNV